MSQDFDRTFAADNGIALGADEDVGLFGGVVEPWNVPVVNAPIGSRYVRTNGNFYKKVGAGDLEADWEVITEVSGGFFAPEFATVQEDGQQQTTSTSWQQVFEIDDTWDGGQYIIMWSGEFRQDEDNKPCKIRVRIDDTSPLLTNLEPDSQKEEWFPFAGHSLQTLSAGNHKIDMDFRATESGKNVRVRDLELTIWRVSI